MSIRPRDVSTTGTSRIKMANRRYQDYVKQFISRKPWFTAAETECLVKLFERNKDILLNRSNTLVANKAKNDCWLRIAQMVNRKGGVDRSVAEIRKRWKDLVSRARKDYKLVEGAKLSNGPEPQVATHSETIWRIYGPQLNIDRHDVYICDQQPRLRLSYGSSEGIKPLPVTVFRGDQRDDEEEDEDEDDENESSDPEYGSTPHNDKSGHVTKKTAQTTISAAKRDVSGSSQEPKLVLISSSDQRAAKNYDWAQDDDEVDFAKEVEAENAVEARENASLLGDSSQYADGMMEYSPDDKYYYRYIESEDWKRQRDAEIAEMRRDLLFAKIEKARLEKIKLESEIEKIEMEKENMALEKEKLELEISVLKQNK